MAIVIDGKALALEIEGEIKLECEDIRRRLGRAPKLAVVLVGDNPASKVYVTAKSKRAHLCGVETVDIKLSGDISDSDLQAEIGGLSQDPGLDGILLQLPLPKPLCEFGAIMKIAPSLDVDGLHPQNQGLLQRGARCFRPCTPRGVMALIDRAREALHQPADLTGLKAVVVGRSILVGKPVATLLLERNCTVVHCHSGTSDLAAECRCADILVAAVGRPEMFTREYIKPGAIVIDVGINRLDSKGLVGDVKFDEVQEIAGAITPVPGGVGPMTIAMLLRNTVDSARSKLSEE